MKRLRIYATAQLAVSLFFLGFSIISFFLTKPSLALFGTVSFLASTITAGSLLSEKVLETGRFFQCNLFTSNVLATLYFAIATFSIQSLVNDTSYIVICGLLFTLSFFGTFIGYCLVSKVQKLASDDITEEETV